MSDGPPLAVIAWPFEHGSPDIGMGAGAALLAGDAALHEALSAAGWAPTVQRILAADPGVGEVARIFDLLRAQEAAVRAARERGAFPLVLAGGCISATGTVAGCDAQGAAWLDAHADYDTPDDNVSGFDGRHGAVDPVRLGLARTARDDPQRRGDRRGACGAARRPRPRALPARPPRGQRATHGTRRLRYLDGGRVDHRAPPAPLPARRPRRPRHVGRPRQPLRVTRRPSRWRPSWPRSTPRSTTPPSSPQRSPPTTHLPIATTRSSPRHGQSRRTSPPARWRSAER